MNYYLNKLMTYQQIHQMYRDKQSIRKIARDSGLNFRTVKQLLSLSEEEFLASCHKRKGRRKLLGGYEDFVHKRLVEYPQTSSAQMHDLLKEAFTDFATVSQKTVYNYVLSVRSLYELPSEEWSRDFQMIAELPYGQQAQVDFGFYNMRTTTGKTRKVQFFCLILSRSRYKYVVFTDTPYTSETVAKAHELAFEYLGGMPQEIVYDQDRLFLVSENLGELMLTERFRSYVSQRSFKTYFCRAADPQSKGKVENMVKYVKQNFLHGRSFKDLETLNLEVHAWLSRTANALAHGTTKKIPAREMEDEVTYLDPWHPVFMEEQALLPYTVRKDNTISWKSNFYSLPLGTYKGRGTHVLVGIEDKELVIQDMDKKELCRHICSVLQGQKILQTDHGRDKSQAIWKMMEEFAAMFEDKEEALGWIYKIKADKPRYIRDQIQLLKATVQALDPLIAARALYYCSEFYIYSATDFRSIAEKMIMEQKTIISPALPQHNPLSGKALFNASAEPAKSNLTAYEVILN